MKKLPKSIRKYIRKEKARIRQSGLSREEKIEAVKSLYNDHKRHIQPSNKKGN